jgi:cytochrome c553
MSDHMNNDDKLMNDHEYDGIQELDNDLPSWWIMLFMVTIVFSVVYLAYYHVLNLGMSPVQAFEQEMKVANEGSTGKMNGKGLYSINCVSCHGKQGQGIDSIKAPQIAGQEKWYLRQQLVNFRSDIRGGSTEDIPGMTMKNIAKTVIKTDKEMDLLVDYVAALKPSKLKPHAFGDIEKGKQKYKMLCFTCHGHGGEGNIQFKAPSLKGLNDWYIVAQLKNFKHGLRGKDDRDIAGKMMAPMTLALSEEDMKNLAVYILTLNK